MFKVFSQPLFYNRLTGKFDELLVSFNGDINERIRPSGFRPGTQYGATDEVRKLIMEWAKEERISAFMK